MALRNRASQTAAIGRPAAALSAALVLASCTPASQPGGALRTERVLGESGSMPGQYAYPRAIDADGEALWVIDKLARVQRIDPATGDATVWWRMPDFALGKPTGVARAPFPSDDGLIDAVWVPDTHYHRVIVYAVPEAGVGGEIDPEPLAQFGSYGVAPGEFIYPTDVAVLLTEAGDAVERVFVSEYGGNDRISVFDADLEFLFAFGELGEGIDPSRTEFQRPQSMAIDATRRELLVADSCNHRVGRFTPDGELIAWIGSPDREASVGASFKFPYGLVPLADGGLLVTEFGGNRLQHVDVTGASSHATFGRAGRGEGELATPWGASAIGGEIYVLDSGNNRILVTRLPGVRGAEG